MLFLLEELLSDASDELVVFASGICERGTFAVWIDLTVTCYRVCKLA